MSFSLGAFGSKQQATEQLAASKGYGDQSLHDAIRDAAQAIVNSAPDDVQFAIEASGHHDYSNQSGSGFPIGVTTFSLKVFRPKK